MPRPFISYAPDDQIPLGDVSGDSCECPDETIEALLGDKAAHTGNDGRPVARSCGGRGAYRIGNDVRPCPRRWRQAFQAVAGLPHDRVGPRLKLREDLRPTRSEESSVGAEVISTF